MEVVMELMEVVIEVAVFGLCMLSWSIVQIIICVPENNWPQKLSTVTNHLQIQVEVFDIVYNREM